MKKILLAVITVFFITVTANATSEDATLTDVKESLYYLIKDYQTLISKIAISKNNIKSLQIKSDELIKKTKEIKKLKNEISLLKNKFAFEKNNNNYQDKIIDNFIKENNDKNEVSK